ncbi:hypothetical protein AMAG_04355 [Allomyces macrogynus ATCC 38327]|uniref:BZIP domain-containing protein n=1 Tax=Allomyces macrogynus (strain ATCC 38327) TaxID=578462 RepID=A0A0L0S8S3_ALLM3|nr:hypothetical protein AMAG_04355 [Allomyces macrogynus ATCC 38327]|eukprot:KNE58805.1 hypothetical protein AMAG_04355 [Allomyces macrogynus ATCC 38327]
MPTTSPPGTAAGSPATDNMTGTSTPGVVMIATNTHKTSSKCLALPEQLPYPTNMIPLDAPIMPPRGSKKRTAMEMGNSSPAGADDDDDLDPSEQAAIEKRMRNTISARKSRARKAAKLELLEHEVNKLAAERDQLQRQCEGMKMDLILAHRRIAELSAHAAHAAAASSAAAVAGKVSGVATPATPAVVPPPLLGMPGGALPSQPF